MNASPLSRCGRSELKSCSSRSSEDDVWHYPGANSFSRLSGLEFLACCPLRRRTECGLGCHIPEMLAEVLRIHCEVAERIAELSP
jgi:hypothetical protein